MSEPTIWDIAMGGNPPEKFVPYADYARLKAEVGELADALKLASEVGIKIADEVTRLKAEVERLRASSFVTAVPVEQYERVIKAGDAVCEAPYLWETDPAVIEWRAAKEGKQP